MRVSVDENMAEEEHRQPRGGSDVGWHPAGGFPHVHLQGVEDVKVNHFVMHTSLLMP